MGAKRSETATPSTIEVMIIFTVLSSTVAGKVGEPWGDLDPRRNGCIWPRQATRGSFGFTKAQKIQKEAMKADNLTIFSENVDTGWHRFSTHCTTWKKRRQKFEIFQGIVLQISMSVKWLLHKAKDERLKMEVELLKYFVCRCLPRGQWQSIDA